MLRLTVSSNKKVGLPNFGSAGASCELSIEVDARDYFENPAALADEIRRAYAVTEQAVEEQLARQVEEPDPRPTVAEPPARNQAVEHTRRQPRPAPQVSEPAPALLDNNDPPRVGRQLYPWAKKQEAVGHKGLVKHLMQWGKRLGLPDAMIEWDQDQTRLAVEEAFHWSRNSAVLN